MQNLLGILFGILVWNSSLEFQIAKQKIKNKEKSSQNAL